MCLKEFRIHTVFQVISTHTKKSEWGWSGWSCGGPTEQVDDAFIISSEESDRVFKEEHEGCIDDSIRQLVGIDLKGCSQHTHTHAHLSHSFFMAKTELRELRL